MTLWSNGLTLSFESVFYESVGWWFNSPSWQLMFFCSLHPQLHGFLLPDLQTFYYQEMARIYPPNAHNSECQIFYFLTFSAERSTFLERTLSHGPTSGAIPCCLM